MLNILIVDDDKNLCECLLNLMPWAEMDCGTPFVAYNGLEAWELLQQEKIDFIICDLKMPIMEGIELCRLIRENGMKIQMVFLSAYEDFSIARQALQYGVTDYILKPINRESLENLEKIVRNVSRSKVKKILTSKFFDETYNKEIFDAISNQDTEFIQKMFENMKELDEPDVLNAEISLLYILYDYLCMMNRGVERSVYDALLKKWRTDIVKLKNKEEKIDYIYSKYQTELDQRVAETDVEQTVREIKRLAEENYSNSDCNVAWIADRLYMTSSYIGRIFNRSMGIGLMEYLTECRMKKACLLLAENQLSVTKIAERVGYTDANYFTKAFRNKIGLSPSEYRRKSRKNEQ